MLNLRIVDGNNWFRRRAEVDLVGMPVSNCFNEVQRHAENSLVIVCWDGFQSLVKRRAIYPEYKVGRKSAGDSIYESQNLLKKVLSFSKAISIQCNGYEADDVIAALCYKYENIPVYVDSNDLDLWQLGRPMFREKSPEPVRYLKLYKTIVGDPSDNIPGFKGFGKGAWAKLSDENKQYLEHVLTSGWGLTELEISTFCDLFMTKAQVNWFKVKENRLQLQKFYEIVGFLPITEQEIESGTTKGCNRPELANKIFAEYMI